MFVAANFLGGVIEAGIQVEMYFILNTLQWNLSYLDLYYPGTSIVQTAQICHVTCSLLTIMKFGLLG